MMTDKEFDEKVRRMCSEMIPQQIPDVWDGIEKKLVLRHRVLFWRRTGMISAAAAVIAAGFVLVYDSDVASPSGTVTVSEARPIVSQNVEVSASTSAADVVQMAEIPSKPVKVQTRVENSIRASSEPASSAVPSEPAAVSILSAGPESVAQPLLPESEADVLEKADTYDTSDYLAFADGDAPAGERILMTVSSDFYTIYGSGNVNFTGRSMSGGSSGTGVVSVKPLSGNTPRHDLPLTAGIGVQYGFGKSDSYGQHRFGVGLGVNYTFLRSSYQALVSKEYLGKYGQGSEQASVVQNVHYLGIPFTFFVNILTTDRIFFYASAGGAVEKGLRLRYKFTDMRGEVFRVSEPVSGLQWSADLGLGFEYRFVKFMGVYVDPRLTYYFDCSQPYSLREEQRLQMTFGVGFRFHF